MTATRPTLVLAVDALSARAAAERYPPCMRPGTTTPLPYADPPQWVLPGGRRVWRHEAQRIAMRMGWAMQEDD